MAALQACQKASTDVDTIKGHVDIRMQRRHVAIYTWMLKLAGIIDSEIYPLRQGNLSG